MAEKQQMGRSDYPVYACARKFMVKGRIMSILTIDKCVRKHYN